jgi:hypothetical protein
MWIKVGNDAYRAEVSWLEPTLSVHTQRSLAAANVKFGVSAPERHEEVLRLVGQNPGARVALLVDEEEIPFQVITHALAHGLEGPRWVHWLRLREFESLAVKRVTMDGLDLDVESYSESEQFGGVIANLEAACTPDLLQSIRRRLASHPIPQYMDVVRHGLQSSPRRMRASRSRWIAGADRSVVYLTLVEDVVDRASPSFGLMRPEVENLVAACARLEAQLSALIGELGRSGLFSEGVVAGIVSPPQRVVDDREWELKRLRGPAPAEMPSPSDVVDPYNQARVKP